MYINTYINKGLNMKQLYDVKKTRGILPKVIFSKGEKHSSKKFSLFQVRGQ